MCINQFFKNICAIFTVENSSPTFLLFLRF
jgi:hypothetical protein